MKADHRRELESATGQTLGTVFEHWVDDNTVVVSKKDSRGVTHLDLAGFEAYALRDFLNTHLPKTRRRK